MRKKKHGRARLDDCGGLWARTPEEHKGGWRGVFGGNQPIHLEIGCGKGAFITQTALANPGVNYIAVEKLIDVLVLAAEKAKAANLSNVRFILGDAALLEEMFAHGEIERIYINFCDPWHKYKHRKRRLTGGAFLEIYKRLLRGDGEIFFKTDNQRLFEFSLNSFCDNGFKLKNITLDLHNSGFEGNIMTEYEKLFSDMGKPVYRLEASSCFAK
jgi:tRNA (guanine-N7-)-methyltransferase